MLSNDPFYWGSVRKIVIAFGACFSNIHIVRVDKNNTSNTKTIKVPLTYGPKEKWLYRVTQDPMPGVDDQVEMVLPRMSYEITSFQYDTSRKLPSTGRTVKALLNDNTVVKAQFNPVPYNISFELNIMTKTREDGLMIVEQILPFFTPDYTVTINDMPDLGLKKDIPIVLNGIQTEDTWNGSFTERRTITWILAFTAKAYLYPPTRLTKVNLEAQVNFQVDGGNGPSGLPSFVTTPVPSDADATTVTDGTVVKVDNSIRILALPSAATLSSGNSKAFSISVINTNTTTFTVAGVSSTDTAVTTGSTFTYTAGTRTNPETITLIFTAVADTSKNASVVLTLNP